MQDLGTSSLSPDEEWLLVECPPALRFIGHFRDVPGTLSLAYQPPTSAHTATPRIQ